MEDIKIKIYYINFLQGHWVGPYSADTIEEAKEKISNNKEYDEAIIKVENSQGVLYTETVYIDREEPKKRVLYNKKKRK